MGNVFPNAQQMLTQLATYIVLSIPLYHASRTFKFINTSPLQEHAFVFKNVASLKTLPLASTNNMCPSIIDKYIKRPNYLSNISFIEFVANYDIVNIRGKKTNFHIIRYVHYNEHRDLENYYKEQLILFIPFFDNEHTFKGDHSTWNAAYNMHEIQINLLIITFIYNFDNNNAYTTNWENIESQLLN
jgi:hypothetical protein